MTPEERALHWLKKGWRSPIMQSDIDVVAGAIRAAILEAYEDAAKICEARAKAYRDTQAPGWEEVDHECTQCATAIRQRSTQGEG